jgi:hypothetical protein
MHRSSLLLIVEPDDINSARKGRYGAPMMLIAVEEGG